MDRNFVAQFRIELLGIEPPVWRRIQVPADYTFWDLHVAIQDAMGWLDYHLHAFQIVGIDGEIGIPDEEWDESNPIRPSWDVQITDLFSEGRPLASYEYDFGDSWIHQIRFEGYHPAEESRHYPCCLNGARRCPPEDCGGVPGYEDFLRVIGDPTDPEHAAMLEWAGGSFDPEQFAPEAVSFDDPTERWRKSFENDEG